MANTLKADFGFDLLDPEGTVNETKVKDLISSQLAYVKSDDIDPITAFEWTLQIKREGFLVFSSSAEYDKLVKFIKEKSEIVPYVKGFILTELKKQNS